MRLCQPNGAGWAWFRMMFRHSGRPERGPDPARHLQGSLRVPAVLSRRKDRLRSNRRKGIWMNVNATHPVDDAALVLPAQLWSRIPPPSRYLDEPGTGLRN